VQYCLRLAFQAAGHHESLPCPADTCSSTPSAKPRPAYLGCSHRVVLWQEKLQLEHAACQEEAAGNSMEAAGKPWRSHSTQRGQHAAQMDDASKGTARGSANQWARRQHRKQRRWHEGHVKSAAENTPSSNESQRKLTRRPKMESSGAGAWQGILLGQPLPLPRLALPRQAYLGTATIQAPK